ncbi:MAG: phosphoribosylformylglycinamidine synthase subunit PurL [Candidatus Thorarchaeota archaeon]
MLTEQELSHASEILQRKLTETELHMFEVLWSENSSYKSSKRWFHLFNTEGERVFLGPGEGAGLVDLGDGVILGIAMESHNHPSQLDPYNGAATGVSGIIRDIVSQGCKPVGLMNCLRFGHPGKSRNAHFLERVVRGISDYSNGVGVPMIGGEIGFDDSYEGNCIVNLVGIGVVTADKVVRSSATTPGQKIVIFGATTGRDGVGGVLFASKIIPQNDEDATSSLPIGDPLAMKILVDALEQLIENKLLSGLQDLGGGGLASAASNLAFKGKTGIDIHLDKVPVREIEMSASDIITSETPERMLGIVAPEHMDQVLEILTENEISHAVIGEVTDTGMYNVLYNDKSIANLPVSLLVDGVPEPLRMEEEIIHQEIQLDWIPEELDIGETLRKLLQSLSLCDRSWIYSQFDQHVQANTIIEIGDNAGCLEFPKGKLVAFTSDCNSMWSKLDPWTGAANSACESLRNLVAVGAEPILIADCMNFGNPEKPESYAQYVDAIRGIGQFSHDFDIPIVSGNVSFYNESENDDVVTRINPTPQIMMAGLIPKNCKPVRRNLVTPWANIFLVGKTHRELNVSEFQRALLGDVKGIPPRYQPGDERRAMQAMLQAHSAGMIRSCNNVGRGGLGVALMKMLLDSKYGFRLSISDIPGTAKSLPEIIFSESPARYLAEVTESNQPQFLSLMNDNDMQVVELGLTQQKRIADFGEFSLDMNEAQKEFKRGLAQYME